MFLHGLTVDGRLWRDVVPLLEGDYRCVVPDLRRPVLLAWAPEDRFFKIEYARRLAADLPDARIETILDSRTFVPIDQPTRTAELIGAFVREAMSV